MIVVCRTTADVSGYEFARLDLNVEYAKQLLKLRHLAEVCLMADEQFYGVEIFDYAVKYGSHLTGDYEPDAGQWYSTDAKLRGVATTAEAATLCATKDGVLWKGYAKHTDTPHSFETDEIEWSDLEAVAKGDDPFEPLATDKE